MPFSFLLADGQNCSLMDESLMHQHIHNGLTMLMQQQQHSQQEVQSVDMSWGVSTATA